MALVIKTAAQVTVTTAGTRVKLLGANASEANVEAVYLSAPAGNTGIIYVGDSSVAAGRGVEVAKGTTFTILAPKGEMIDMATINIDAATNGDKVNVTYLKRNSS